MKNSFQNYTDWALKGLLTAAVTFFATEVRQLSSTVQELNTKMSIIVVKFDAEHETNADQEVRIRALERQK